MPSLPKTGVELIAQGLNDFLGDMKRAGRAVDDFGDNIGKSAKGIGAFGEVMTGSLRRVGEIGADALMDAGRATADFVKSGIASAGDVEQTLNVLQVAGKATDAQMALVSQRAIALGGDLQLPATSAVDASNAMLELVKAGLSVDQSMEAAKGTLQLAAAAETDAATAAQVMSSALNAFRLPASEAVHLTDLLAGAANASQANIADLSQGFNQAGFMFSATGQKADDLAVSLAILTKNGLTGSDAGTALKNAMNRLINPVGDAGKVMYQLGFNAYDAAGVMKPWPQIVNELRDATAKLTPEERNLALSTIFLSDGFKAMNPLLSLSKEELAGMYAQVTASGQASELAGAQMKGWAGAVDGFNSQMETLGLVIGQQLLPVITPLLQQLGEAISKLTSGDFSGFFQGITDIVSQMVIRLNYELARLAEGTSPISPFLDSLVAAFKPLGDLLIGEAKLLFGRFSGWLVQEVPPMLAPLGPVLITAATDWFKQLNTWIETQAPVILKQLEVWGEQFVTWIEPLIPPLMAELDKLVAKFGEGLEARMPAIKATLAEWGKQAIVALGTAILLGIAELGVALGMWILEQEPHINKALNLWAAQFAGWVNNGIAQMLEDLGNVWNTLKNWFGEMAGNILHEAGQMGSRMIEGFGNAIQAGIGWVRDQAWNMANAAREAAMHALGIGSPSKVFEQIGAWTAEGMQMGVAAGTPAVQGAMTQMASPVAYPGGGGGATTNVSNTLNFQPSYGAAVVPNPQRDSIVARSMAL
jgi:TP901 family phage tail tape measure protein